MNQSQQDVDMDQALIELNNDKARVLIPAILYCGLLMLVGTVGNTMVLFYYGLKTKTTPATCFILNLAIFDLVACVFGIPIEITDMRFFFVFKNIPACRLLVFVNHLAVISSAFTLSAIAWDRYRRICKPFEQQMSIKNSKIVCIFCAGLGVLLGWPSIALYTVEEVPIITTYKGHSINITGYDCTSVKSETYSVYAWTFSVIQFIGFFGITTVLVICYFLVGRQLYKHKKFRFYVAQKNLRRTASGNMTTITTNTDYYSNSDQGVTSIPIASIPEEDEEELEEVEYEGPDDDMPIEQEVIPSLKDILELDANGLTEIDTDRPSSVLSGFLGERTTQGKLSRPSSILTDLSVRSKGSIMTVRSVTIRDESENEVFDIEPREQNGIPPSRPRSARSESTWSNSINRPGSASSINDISSHTSVTSINKITETTAVVNITSKVDMTSNTVTSNGIKRSSGLKRTRSDGCVISSEVRRSDSNRSNSSKPSGLRRTTSEGSGIRRSSSNRSVTSHGLRRTGSSESTRLETDTDNLKEMRMKMLDINTLKYTFIMIVIALVFVLSCVPYLILAVWRVYSDDDLVYNFNNTELVWFQIGLRSYFLNCAINPFIYGFFNSQFRDYFYQLCCCLCASRDKVSNDVIDSPGR